MTRTPFHDPYSFWLRHDGSDWAPSPVWDTTFPKFEAASKREAIEMYRDFYYEEAQKLSARHADNFRIFDIEHMSNRKGQKDILAFVGIKEEEMVLKDEFHLHKLK